MKIIVTQHGHFLIDFFYGDPHGRFLSPRRPRWRCRCPQRVRRGARRSAAPLPRRARVAGLVYAQLSGNRRGGECDQLARHPYFMVDLITRSAYNTLAWVDEELKLQLELATRIEPADESLQVWEATIARACASTTGALSPPPMSPPPLNCIAAGTSLTADPAHRGGEPDDHPLPPGCGQIPVPLRAGRIRLRGDAGEPPTSIASAWMASAPAPSESPGSDPQRRMTFERFDGTGARAAPISTGWKW